MALYNITPASNSVFGMLEIVNNSTSGLFGISILILVYVLTYITANRSNNYNAIVPATLLGSLCALFLWGMGFIAPYVLILSIFIAIISIVVSFTS